METICVTFQIRVLSTQTDPSKRLNNRPSSETLAILRKFLESSGRLISRMGWRYRDITRTMEIVDLNSRTEWEREGETRGRGREIKRENERSVSTVKTACKAGTGTMVRLIRLMNTCRARIIVCLSAWNMIASVDTTRFANKRTGLANTAYG